MLIRPRLPLEASGEPFLDLFVRSHSTRANVGEALRDLLLHVDVVLDVLERGGIRELLISPRNLARPMGNLQSRGGKCDPAREASGRKSGPRDEKGGHFAVRNSSVRAAARPSTP